MEQKSPLWSFLEELEDFNAPLADWKNALDGKTDIDKFRHCFLSSMDRYAKSTRCFTPCEKRCPRNLLWHEKDHIEAVCQESRCNSQVFDEHDILIYKFEVSRLHKILADKFNFKFAEQNLSDKRRYCLGDYSPYAGINYPVYISYYNYTPSMTGMVKSLCANNQGKFILLSTSQRFLDLNSALMLKNRGAVFVSLEDELIIDKQCDVSLRRDATEVFASLLDKDSHSNPEFFPTPPDAKWEDIRIHFTNEHTVTIQAGECIFTRNYFQMGMANSLNNGPVDRWHFLRNIAEGYGAYGWDGVQPSPANKKQKQLLCENLSEFFRIPGEPLYWDEGRKAYIARFQIRPDTHSTNWKGREKKPSLYQEERF